MLTLVANSRPQPIGRSLGKTGCPGDGNPRSPMPWTNSPPVSMLVLGLGRLEGLPEPGVAKVESSAIRPHPLGLRAFCVANLCRKTSDFCDEFRDKETETPART